jgi:PAS domain S-box-containing protein
MKGPFHFFRNSVRGRLTLLVVALMAPAGLLVIFLVFQAYRNEQRAIAQHLTATARAIASVVDRQFGQSESLLMGLEASPDLASSGLTGFQRRAEAVMKGRPGWIVLADQTGRTLATVGGGATELPRFAGDREYETALAEGRTFVSNLFTGPGLRQHYVCVVLPVMEGLRVKYTLSHVISPAAFALALQPERFLPGSFVAILDRTGTIAARSPGGDRFTGSKATRDLIAAMTSRAEGSRTGVTLEGERVMSVYSRAAFSGWSVAMGVPLAFLNASAGRLLWPGLVAAVVLTLIAVLMTAWISRALVRGADTLVNDAENMGRGIMPPQRSSGLVETDFVAAAMRKSAMRLKEREDENAALAAGLKAELEQKQRSEESIRRLAAIVESSEDAIVSKDLAGTVTSWNRSAQRLFGYTADEMVGRSITALIPPDREKEGPAILERIKCGERIEHFETFRVRKDGALVPISLTVSPVYDHAGNIIGASKISRDITQRRRAELHHQALYELVARVNRAEALPEIYYAALDAMGRCIETDRAAILLCDASGSMRFVASRGLSEEYQRAASGHSPWQRSDPQPKLVWIDDVATATFSPALKEAVLAEGIRALAFVPLTYEKRLLGKFMIYFNSPHSFSTAELRPVETIARQVAFAIERQRDAEALEALVSERTASLRQAVGQMEEFSYTVSHDLRAPVRAMRGYADIIMQDHGWRLDADARELLTRIIRNGERMDRLIQDLLTYSRISRRELRLEPVSLDKIVREVVAQFPDMQPERADIEVQGPLPDVIAHEPSLSQVISNLLGNAVKFVAPQSRPRVRVSADLRDAQARLWIVDNGIGIKPEHQGRLFGMFERVHPEREYEGTGIGLAIVRKAIERMNGAVGMESDGVTGSKFWVELPIVRRSPDTNGS